MNLGSFKELEFFSTISWTCSATDATNGKTDILLSFFSAFIPAFSSHPVWPSRFASGRLLQRAQGDTWLLRHRWETVFPGLLTTALFFFWFVSSTKVLKVPVQLVQTSTHSFCSLVLFQCDGNLWLCYEGHSSRLTHFQLTDTIIHCSCTSVQPEHGPLDSQAGIFLQGQQRLVRAGMAEEWINENPIGFPKKSRTKGSLFHNS